MARKLQAPKLNGPKKLINTLVFVIDRSGSMQSYWEETVDSFENQINHWKKLSRAQKQETRVSLAVFDNSYQVVAQDVEISKFSPSILKGYPPRGTTNLVNSSVMGVRLAKTLTEPREAYADAAMLVTILTDGQENCGGVPENFRKEIYGIDNLTVSILCPMGMKKYCSNSLGIPEGNILEWETSKSGIEQYTSSTIFAATSYIKKRAQGITRSSTYFTDLSSATTKLGLGQLVRLIKGYRQFTAPSEVEIRAFVEEKTKAPYILGNSYYELMKKEKIQPQKDLIIVNKTTGAVYTGSKLRQFLGLPDAGTCTVTPGNHGDWILYVQSTSVNRKIPRGTHVLVLV